MKYLRRIVWYAASRLFLIVLLLSLMVTVFYYAMNLANIQVVLKDGMAARATYVMMDSDVELDKYFLPSFLETDAVLLTKSNGTNPYEDYTVRGIDHRISLGFLWLWPWDDSAVLEITERIPAIDGRAKGSKAEELVNAGGSSALYPPSWNGGRYQVALLRENGRWKIKSLRLLESLK